MKSLLICLALVSAVYSQSFCDKYVNITGLPANQLVSLVVNYTVVGVVNPANGIVQYFNGTTPAGSTNFLGDSVALAALFNKLVQFFGFALQCSDGTISPYTGRTMALAHATMGVNYFAYAKFNTLVAQTLTGALASVPGSAADIAGVATALHGFKADICNNRSDCNTICNKYSVPFNLNNNALVTLVVTNAFTAINGSDLLKPFFNGTTPAGSTNFFTNPTAALNLVNGLVTFFGVALGCSDGSIGPYTGRTMLAVHANMPINNAVFTGFNGALAGILTSLGVNSTDVAAAGVILESTRADICNQPDCFPASSSVVNTVSNSVPITSAQTTGQRDSSAFVFAPLVALVAPLLYLF